MVCIQTKVSYKLLPAWQRSRLVSLLVYFFNVQSLAYKTDVKENYFCKVFEYTLFIIFESLLLTENEYFLEITKRKKNQTGNNNYSIHEKCFTTKVLYLVHYGINFMTISNIR